MKIRLVLICSVFLLLFSVSVSAVFSSTGPLLIDFTYNRLVVVEGGIARFPFTLSSGFTSESSDSSSSNSSKVIEVDLTQQSFPDGVSCWFEDSSGKNVGGLWLNVGGSVSLVFNCRVDTYKRGVIPVNAVFNYKYFDPKFYYSVSQPSTVYRTVYLVKPDSDLVDIQMEDGGIYTKDSVIKVKGALKSVSGGSYDIKLSETGWTSSITGEDGVPVYKIKLDPDVKKVFYVNLLSAVNISSGVHNFTLMFGNTNTSFSVSLLDSPSRMIDVSVDYYGKAVDAGDSVQFTVGLSNLGSPEAYRVYVTDLPKEWSYMVLSDKEERLTKVYLNSAVKTSLNVKFTTPSDENAGEYSPKLVLESDGFNKIVALSVTVLQEKKLYDLGLNSPYPKKSAVIGRSIEYPVQLNNTGINKDVYDLSVIGLPEGWSYQFKESSSGSSISSVEVGSSSNKELTLQLNPSPDAELKEYPFTVQVSSVNVNKSLNVSVVLGGSYNANLKFDNLYLVVDAGVEGQVQVKVENTGSKELRSIELDAVKPEGWDVTVTPAKINILQPQMTGNFVIKIKSLPDTGVGDYMLKVKAKTAEIETKEESVRVTVNRTSFMGYVGVALIFAAILFLAIVFKKFGRK
jgi:uncharacterized membrane protein